MEGCLETSRSYYGELRSRAETVRSLAVSVRLEDSFAT